MAAGETVGREALRGLALAVLAGTRAGRIALAVLRAVSDEECLSWGLELSDAVLGPRMRPPAPVSNTTHDCRDARTRGRPAYSFENCASASRAWCKTRRMWQRPPNSS